MERRISMLDIFPVELLLLVKDLTPEIDLRTHACFAQVCGPASKSLYNDAYWEKACVKFGLGLLPGEDAATTSWREIAFDVIQVDGFCQHPQCGTRRLAQNYREMSKVYMKDFTRNALMQVFDSSNAPAVFNGIMTNTLFSSFNFNPYPYTEAKEDGFLYIRDQPQEACQPSSPLSKHPIASRSFATFTPSSKLQLITLNNIPLIRNPLGVTVWDVFTTVQSRLDDRESVYVMNEYLRFVDYRKALGKRGDDITHLLNQLTTLRDFFHIFRWDGLCCAGQDSNRVPRFAFGFKTVRRVVKGVEYPELIV